MNERISEMNGELADCTCLIRTLVLTSTTTISPPASPMHHCSFSGGLPPYFQQDDCVCQEIFSGLWLVQPKM